MGAGGCLGRDLVDGLGHVVDVLGGNAGDGDATVLGQVDVEVLGQPLHLETSCNLELQINVDYKFFNCGNVTAWFLLVSM